MARSWTMEADRLVFHHPAGDLYWAMPEGYSLPSRAILSLAEYLLLSPYGESVEVLPRPQFPDGRTAVAFSGGVDSAAVLQLVQDPIPIYTQVDNPGGLHRLENALLAVDEVGGIAVRTNQDLLPTFYGRSRGFYGVGGWTTTSVLLAEHLRLATVTDGNILEFVYMRTSHGHGTAFHRRDLTAQLDVFRRAGLHYSMPVAGMTEVSTTRIAKTYRFAMGCMRGSGGEPCLRCMKCYRKSAIQGRPIDTNPEAEKVLSKEWVPVLGSLLWARDNHGLAHPRLSGLDLDYSWVDKWYAPSIEYVPEAMRPHFLERLRHFDIKTVADEGALHSWSSRVGPS